MSTLKIWLVFLRIPWAVMSLRGFPRGGILAICNAIQCRGMWDVGILELDKPPSLTPHWHYTLNPCHGVRSEMPTKEKSCAFEHEAKYNLNNRKVGKTRNTARMDCGDARAGCRALHPASTP